MTAESRQRQGRRHQNRSADLEQRSVEGTGMRSLFFRQAGDDDGVIENAEVMDRVVQAVRHLDPAGMRQLRKRRLERRTPADVRTVGTWTEDESVASADQ